MDAVNDFKSIRRKLERQEQKDEFEEKNPPMLASFFQALDTTVFKIERDAGPR